MVQVVGVPARRAEPDGRIGRAAARGLGQDQGRDRTFRAAGAAGASRGAAAARGRYASEVVAPRLPRRRHVPTSSGCRPGPALAQHRELHHGDRGRPGRDDRGRGSISRICCPTAFARSRAPRWSRSRRRRRRRRRRPNMSRCCRRMAGRRPSFSRSTGRPRISRCARSARSPSPARALSSGCLRQAAAAALARRDRRQRLHRASGAGVLRSRHRQQRDLCGDGRAGQADRRPAVAHSAPIVFTGKLIETVPPAAPAATKGR